MISTLPQSYRHTTRGSDRSTKRKQTRNCPIYLCPSASADYFFHPLGQMRSAEEGYRARVKGKELWPLKLRLPLIRGRARLCDNLLFDFLAGNYRFDGRFRCFFLTRSPNRRERKGASNLIIPFNDPNNKEGLNFHSGALCEQTAKGFLFAAQWLSLSGV